jgi:hypothetical protein
MERERLLVRQRKDVLAAGPVLQAEELRNPGAAGRLPQLDRRQHGREPFLRAERVELLADDLLDPPVHAPAERREAPEPRRELTDEPTAHEQLVRDRLRVGGVLSQGR